MHNTAFASQCRAIEYDEGNLWEATLDTCIISHAPYVKDIQGFHLKYTKTQKYHFSLVFHKYLFHLVCLNFGHTILNHVFK